MLTRDLTFSEHLQPPEQCAGDYQNKSEGICVLEVLTDQRTMSVQILVLLMNLLIPASLFADEETEAHRCKVIASLRIRIQV